MEQYITTILKLIDSALERKSYNQFARYTEMLIQNIISYKNGKLRVSEEEKRYFDVIDEEGSDDFVTELRQAISFSKDENELAFVMYHRFKSHFTTDKYYDEIGNYLT